jgi:hypothetical protein
MALKMEEPRKSGDLINNIGAKRPFGRTQGHPRARSGRVFLDARQAKNDGSYSVAVYAGRAPTSTGVTISDFAKSTLSSVGQCAWFRRAVTTS